jgi:hypothetical protein
VATVGYGHADQIAEAAHAAVRVVGDVDTASIAERVASAADSLGQQWTQFGRSVGEQLGVSEFGDRIAQEVNRWFGEGVAQAMATPGPDALPVPSPPPAPPPVPAAALPLPLPPRAPSVPGSLAHEAAGALRRAGAALTDQHVAQAAARRTVHAAGHAARAVSGTEALNGAELARVRAPQVPFGTPVPRPVHVDVSPLPPIPGPSAAAGAKVAVLGGDHATAWGKPMPSRGLTQADAWTGGAHQGSLLDRLRRIAGLASERLPDAHIAKPAPQAASRLAFGGGNGFGRAPW